jgi:hypothetical protein
VPTSNTNDPISHRRLGPSDRRSRLAYAIVYGAWHPRRRAARRAHDDHRPIVDLHSKSLFVSAVVVLLLCVVDAFFTLHLLQSGAIEANPLMAPLVQGSASVFAIVKLALTGTSLVALVAVSRVRIFRILRAGTIVHAAVAAYAGLIGYEIYLLAYPA